ncbi:MAG: IS3 family transposase, partial [Acidocella sp. 21-58-7]
MIAFIEEHRDVFGVEPICKVLPLAPSTYYERLAIAKNPDLASLRAKSDADTCREIERIWQDNRKVYGARKIWHALRRERQDVARCTVERLMRRLGLQGVVRGHKIITTNPDTS